MPDGLDLYLVQSPAVVSTSLFDKGYNQDLLEHYDGSISVTSVADFVTRIQVEVGSRKKLVRKLVIGAHGGGSWGGGGYFYIGENVITETEQEHLKWLAGIAPLFTKDAQVYIMACQTGNNETLLKKLSEIWGGITVRGYTGLITTNDYWLWIDIDRGGDEVVCIPSSCNGGGHKIIQESK